MWWLTVKKLKGRITDPVSGIYIELPRRWNAYALNRERGESMFVIGKGSTDPDIVSLSVTHHLNVEKGDGVDRHILTDEIIELERKEDGDFSTYNYGLSETRQLYVWETETEKYFIRFLFICAKKNTEKKLGTVQQIVHSLVKHPPQQE